MDKPPYLLITISAVILTMGCAGYLRPLPEIAPVETEVSLILSSTDPIKSEKKTPDIRGIIVNAALANEIPPEFAMAVAEQESGLKPHRTGSIGEIGLFQLRCGLENGKPLTAQVLGYRGKCKGLYDPTVNAYWGTLHLKLALEKSNGNWCKAAILHNEGLNSPSKKSKYCREVMDKIAAL